MAKRPLQGVQLNQEVDVGGQTPDVRPIQRRLYDWLNIPVNVVVTILVMAAAGWWVAELSAWLCFFGLGLTLWAMSREENAPLKMPIQSKMMDPNQPHAATGAPTPGQGIFFLGNDLKNGKEAWLTNSDCRQHFLVLGTTGAGKALSLSALVHTPLGWRRMGDIKVGDRVSTPDGESARVAGYYPQGELDICRITFEDGRIAEACPEHLWEIHHKNRNGRYKPGISRAGKATTRVMTTAAISELVAKNKGTFSVRLPEATEKPTANLPIKPYLLGTLLGDGNAHPIDFRFASVENEMLELVGQTHPAGPKLHHHENDILSEGEMLLQEGAQKSNDTLSLVLKNLGLHGLQSSNKFVPQSFKESSIEQRWALVQGLMDTDGAYDVKKRSISFSTSSEKLARDLQELVWSLGGIAEIGTSQSKSHTALGEKPTKNLSFSVQIRHPDLTRFFTLPSKACVVDELHQPTDSLKVNIKKVEMCVRREEAACIKVDHPDSLFITNDYVVTHNTESLLGFGANALSWGSGFLFCDGKGDVSLFAKVFAMARRFGREDDLLVLNFMNSNESPSEMGGKLKSNTMNPFATGSSDGLTQMVVSLMDDVGGDGAMWKGRATAMLTGVMRALCNLRDAGLLDLNVSAIRDHMNLREIIALSDENKHPDLPPPIRKSIRSYLSSLPGYQEDKKEKQSQTTLDQHGFLEMQFTKILGSLADVYGHIFSTPYGEVDMYDVVLNRRILVIMLPALEKSGDEIANLGKIVVATLKGMMGATLGSKLEGSWFEVVENRPTKSPSPFLCILDEVGYYTVEGMAIMAAMARSLGFSMIYASQDIPAMKRLNEKEAASITANTNTKIFLRTEEVGETGDLAVKTAGKALRARIQGFERQTGEVAGVHYNQQENAGFELSDRIDFLDLKAQGEGEMHVLFQDKLVRLRGFYANPEGSLDKDSMRIRTNHFLKVPKPSNADMAIIHNIPIIIEKFTSPDLPAKLAVEISEALSDLDDAADNGDEIAMVAKAFDEMIRAKRPEIEAGCAAIAKVLAPLRAGTSGFSDGVRDAYAMPVPPQRGFNMDDLEDDRMDGRGNLNAPPPRGGFQLQDEFDDSFSSRGGVPMADSPPPSSPPRARPFAAPKKPTRVDPDVRHGATVNDGAIINMADNISANEAIMKSLAALDFVEDMTSSQQVEANIQKAVGVAPPKKSAAELVRDNDRIAGRVADFDRASANVTAGVEPHKGSDKHSADVGAGAEGGELVSAFLDGLLTDGDDD